MLKRVENWNKECCAGCYDCVLVYVSCYIVKFVLV